MTLYADVLFIINFAMNAFVLYVTARLLRNTRKRRWWVSGAGLMAFLYTLVLAVTPLRGVNLFIAQAVILTAGVMIAFFPRGAQAIAKHMLAAYMVTFVVGGLGMALFFLTDLPYAVHYIAGDLGVFSQSVSLWLVFAGTGLSYILIKLGQYFIERRNLKKQLLCPVQIFMDETNVAFEALVDTGHSLREPLSNAPVIVAEFERVKPFLPEGLQQIFYEKKESNLTALLLGQENIFYTRLRMIPFTSIGRANGMLVGFRPDKVIVQDENEPHSREDVIIGIYNDKFTRDGRYQGLLSAELVN
ncbi:MAG: sigma-E processing peptidase SpoIIGA [Defluviitaleaceae bacterium]|nr:sigma-E processing peptidase SpoIIGA [Defluviitaleaceae bacterium]MCL2276106.1 sigma-E processing peptidase SpoIIGA [Defluviitaleaceae bacterium]